MKNLIFKIVALCVFASIAFTSCSVEYREHHRRPVEEKVVIHDDHHDDRRY